MERPVMLSDPTTTEEYQDNAPMVGVVSETGLSGRVIEATEGLILQGEDLSDRLWRMPWGVVQRGVRTTNAAHASQSVTHVQPFLRVNFTASAGRLYKVTAFGATGSVNAEGTKLVCHLRTSDGMDATVTAPPFTDTESGVRVGDRTTVPIAPMVGTIAAGPSDREVSILWTFRAEGGSFGTLRASGSSPARIVVEDIGGSISDAGVSEDGTVLEADPVPPPKSTPKNTTQIWYASSVKSYSGHLNESTTRAYQGYTQYDPAGGLKSSAAAFGLGSKGQTLQQALNGATEVTLRLEATWDHWHYAGGGKARVHVHGASSVSSKPSLSYVGEQSVANPGTLRYNLGPAVINGFANGEWKGIGFEAPNTSATYYGYARASSIRLIATYKK